jgi:mannitol-1-/sugar-/sorbitol-6-phosphatase
MDGVLVDSTPAVARVWSRWAREQDLAPELAVATAHGRRSLETIRTLAPHMDAEQENQRVEAMEIAEKDGITALAGSAEILHSLPPEKFAIVTSATRALAAARLSYAGLPAVTRMVCADDVVHGKPSPDPYLQGAALLGAAPQDCLVFEDTPTGIQSALAAGMRVIALLTTYAAAELRAATAIARSLAEVTVVREGDQLRLGVPD